MLDFDVVDLFDPTQQQPEPDHEPDPDHDVNWAYVVVGGLVVGGLAVAGVRSTIKTLEARGEIPPSI